MSNSSQQTQQHFFTSSSAGRAALTRRRRIPAFICLGDVRVDALVDAAAGHDMLLGVRHRLPLGQQVEVALQPLVPTVELKLPGTVHWINPAQDEFLTGIVLQTPVPDDFLLRHPGCERSHLRFSCQVTGEVEWPTEQRRSQATVINYSRTGICLQTRSMPRAGSPLTFRWNNPSPQQICGTVCWVSAERSLVVAGCETPPGTAYALSGVTGISSH